MMKILTFVFLFLFVSISKTQPKIINALQEKSLITYSLEHPLHIISATSKQVSSVAKIDSAKKIISAVSAVVDVTTFNSGNSSRDSHAMEVVDALTFPEVIFISSKIYSVGNKIAVEGKLTFHGVTKNVTISAVPKWNEKELEVSAEFTIQLTAFGIEPPSLLMVPVDNDLKFTLHAVYSL